MAELDIESRLVRLEGMIAKKERHNRNRVKGFYTPIVFSQELVGDKIELKAYLGMNGKIRKIVALSPWLKDKQTITATLQITDGHTKTISQILTFNRVLNVTEFEIEVTEQTVVKVTLKEPVEQSIWVSLIIQPTDMSQFGVKIDLKDIVA